MIIRNSGVLMTMPSFPETSMLKFKFAILAIAVLLELHIGAGHLFAQDLLLLSSNTRAKTTSD